MSQLRPGARQALDHARADLEEIIEMAYNPAAVEALARRCIRRLYEDIEPKMQRAEPIQNSDSRILRIALQRLKPYASLWRNLMPDKPPLTEAERVINRTRAVQMNKGRGWSKAMDFAAETVKKAEQPQPK